MGIEKTIKEKQPPTRELFPAQLREHHGKVGEKTEKGSQDGKVKVRDIT